MIYTVPTPTVDHTQLPKIFFHFQLKTGLVEPLIWLLRTNLRPNPTPREFTEMTQALNSALTTLSDRAAELHNEMMNTQPEGHMFKQAELQDLIQAKNINELMRYVQELTDNVSGAFNRSTGFRANVL